jgi:DNA-binding MarR family transcriptional regulator/GNAT superfamily N-acetyltransferase
MEGLDRRVDAVRRFNRFYTKTIGVLTDGLLDSPYSLAESRVLYELAHREQTTASEIGASLALDPGYLSRILKSFEAKGLVTRRPSASDGRTVSIALTGTGNQAASVLDARAADQIAGVLSVLSEPDQRWLVSVMGRVRGLLGDAVVPRAYTLREAHVGDYGWVVSVHGSLYAKEYGWDETFEGLVADIVAQFIKTRDSRAERCWIAEVDGVPVGSVFLVRHSDEVAKLRLLIVDPSARGLGIGAALVDECIRFARQAGYRTMTLWTQSILTAARAIYRKAGFLLVKEEPHRSFGAELVGETWELAL